VTKASALVFSVMACLISTACHDAAKPESKPTASAHRTETTSNVALPPAPARFVLGSGGAAVWYNTKTRRDVGNVLRPDKAFIVATASFPSQTELASAYKRIDRPCLSVVESETIDPHGDLRLGTFPKIGIEPADVSAVAVSPDGHLLAIGELAHSGGSSSSCTQPVIVIIDLTRGVRRQSPLPWSPGLPVAKLAWSSDGQVIEAATPSGSAGLLDLWTVDPRTVGTSAVAATRTRLSKCAATDVASTATETLVLLGETNCDLGRSIAILDPRSGTVRPVPTAGALPAVDRFSADRTGTHLVLFEHGRAAAYLWDGGVVTPITTPIPGPIAAAAW